MVRNRVGTCLQHCIDHLCTKITFSFQLRSTKPPQPAEPRQLMCFCYLVSPAPCLFSFSPMQQIHLCGICPHQRNQPKQSCVIKVYCSINKAREPCSPRSSSEFLMMKSHSMCFYIWKLTIWKHCGNLFGAFERKDVNFEFIWNFALTKNFTSHKK